MSEQEGGGRRSAPRRAMTDAWSEPAESSPGRHRWEEPEPEPERADDGDAAADPPARGARHLARDEPTEDEDASPARRMEPGATGPSTTEHEVRPTWQGLSRRWSIALMGLTALLTIAVVVMGLALAGVFTPAAKRPATVPEARRVALDACARLGPVSEELSRPGGHTPDSLERARDQIRPIMTSIQSAAQVPGSSGLYPVIVAELDHATRAITGSEMTRAVSRSRQLCSQVPR